MSVIKNKSLFAALGSMALFYFAMMPRSVTLEDSGEMLMVASSFGVAHPPGYPLMGMIGGLFGLLPTGNFALNIHLMSAAFGVLTLAVVYHVAMQLTKDRWSSLFGIVLAGLSPTITWYFTVAEVYSQFTLLFCGCLYLVIANQRTEWLAFLLGLGFCGHWPLFVLSGPALVIARPRVILQIRPRHFLFFALGLAPIAFLYIRSQWANPYMTAGGAETLGSLMDLLARKYYHRVEKADVAGLRDEFLFFKHTCMLIWRNYWWVGTGFAFAGISTLLVRRQWRISLSLLWLMFGANLATRVFLRAEYDVLFGEELEQFHVLPLLAFGMAAACGAWAVYQQFPKHRAVISALLILSALSLFMRNLKSFESRAQNSFASEMAKFYLSLAPPNSIYLMNGDPDIGPLTFVNRIEHFRPDVTVYAQSGFLARPEGMDLSPGYEERLALFLRAQVKDGRNVVFHRVYPQMERALIGLEKRDYEILTEMAGPGGFAGLPPGALASAIQFADRYASGEIKTSRWTYHQESLLGPLCRFLVRNQVDHPILNATVYCRYYSLRDRPPADPVLAAAKAKELLAAAEYFPKDEKATIEKLVARYLR